MNKPGILSVILIGGVLCLAGGLSWPQLAANVTNSRLLWAMVSETPGGASGHLTAETDSNPACGTYPQMIAAVYSHPADQAVSLTEIDRAIACWPNRQSLFDYLKLESFWASAQHPQACSLAQRLHASGKAVELLQRSFNRADYAATEIYLKCVLSADFDGEWISPFVLAQVYFGMGKHYESENRLTEAREAYWQAASRYPVVWAAPYVALAKVMDLQGESAGAEELLLDTVKKKADELARLELWLGLAQLWAEKSESVKLACAYLNAKQLIGQVPASSVTESMRTHIETATKDTPVEQAKCWELGLGDKLAQ